MRLIRPRPSENFAVVVFALLEGSTFYDEVLLWSEASSDLASEGGTGHDSSLQRPQKFNRSKLPLAWHVVVESAEDASGRARAIDARVGIRQVGVVEEVEGFPANLYLSRSVTATVLKKDISSCEKDGLAMVLERWRAGMDQARAVDLLGRQALLFAECVLSTAAASKWPIVLAG